MAGLSNSSQAASLLGWWKPPAPTTLLPTLAEVAARGTGTTRICKGNPVTSSIQG